MSGQQDKIYGIGATLISLAALDVTHFPTLVKPPTGCVGMDIKTITGASTGILPNTLSGATIGGATTVGASISGYPLPVGTNYTVYGPASFYLAALATSTVAINFWYSAQGCSFV